MKEKETVIKIENNVPLPARGRALYSAIARTMARMEIGQSIVVPHSQRTALSAAARGANIRITSKMLEDRKTVRVWRIE